MGLCIVEIHGEIEGDYDIIGKYEEPKIGHWVRWYETIERVNCTIHDPHCKCSECDQEYDPYNASLFNYCPNCGCRIVEPQECEDENTDWYDIPADEMTEKQLRRAVKDLRKELMEKRYDTNRNT